MKALHSRATRFGMVGVVLASLSAAAPAVLAADAQVALMPASVVVQPGQRATIDVALSTEAPIRGAQMRFHYDPNVVRIEFVTEGTFFRNWATPHGASSSIVFPFTPDNVVGQTAIGGIALFGGPPHQGASGTGTLISLHILGVPDAPAGASNIEMSSLILADAEGNPLPRVEAIGASVVVGRIPDQLAAPPAPVVISVAPRPSVPELSALDTVTFWLRRNQVGVGVIGLGLAAAATIYVAVLRLAPGARRTHGQDS